MAEFDDFGGLEGKAEDLNATLETTGVLVSGFESELRRMSGALAATGKDVQTLEKGLSKGLRRAFDGVVFDGMKLSDALKTVAQSLANTTYNAAMKPVTDHFGGLVSQGVGALVQGILPFAKGAAFSQGRVMPVAQGGVVSGATTFPMRGGTGLMGEAGPEAIMPLARGPDGKLGVRSASSPGPAIVMNITTPDVTGFQRSQSQIAAQMSRALSSGNRNR
ncbi:phage tail tape measure protein [Sulfitobacter sp. F26204]|uniref:phage tail tape measure protein n=1 Tax=Sulfitobacter sp. F26204 TaxID=2996014 RepID=UPI00225E39F4|nr:phage tail tape measure protein [Sulfitobacter sp. F26204]MCX7560073.1 phage tail tape measure protein [Sulfitobacter sp. F26204]